MTEEQIAAIKMALDYILTITELSVIRDGKHEAVKKQDFEDAVKWRGLETELMKSVPTHDQVKAVREKINQP